MCICLTLKLTSPLLSVNAASKGHLPVVLYLLTKQNADPYVRNNWGETAYDAAAAVFEVWICEVSAQPVGYSVRAERHCMSCRRPKSRIGAIGMSPTTPYLCILRYLSYCMRISALTCA